MGRKVTENHNIDELVIDNVAEELIKQQNETEEYVIGKENFITDSEYLEKNNRKIPKKEFKKAEKGTNKTVVLTGASTYLDSGIRFFKNVPVEIKDKTIYEQLLKTGLFISI